MKHPFMATSKNPKLCVTLSLLLGFSEVAHGSVLANIAAKCHYDNACIAMGNQACICFLDFFGGKHEHNLNKSYGTLDNPSHRLQAKAVFGWRGNKNFTFGLRLGGGSNIGQKNRRRRPLR